MNEQSYSLWGRAFPTAMLLLGLIPFAVAFLADFSGAADLKSKITLVRLVGAVVIVGGGGFLSALVFGWVYESNWIVAYRFIAISVFAVTAVALVPVIPSFFAVNVVYGFYVWKAIDPGPTGLLCLTFGMTMLHMLAHVFLPIMFSID